VSEWKNRNEIQRGIITQFNTLTRTNVSVVALVCVCVSLKLINRLSSL